MLTSYNIFIILVFLSPFLLFFTFWPLTKGFLKFRKAGESNKMGLCLLGLLILVPITLLDLYVWFLCIVVFPVYPHYKFDKSDWATNVSQRFKMADDVVDSQMLIGLTRQQAIELLGKPYRDWDNTDHTIRFDIGERPTPGLDLDPDELVLDLKDGKVVKSYLHET
jgi:hypothetical protein